MNVFFLEVEECNMISPAGNGNGKQFGVEKVCFSKKNIQIPGKQARRKNPLRLRADFFFKCDIGDAKGGKWYTRQWSRILSHSHIYYKNVF